MARANKDRKTTPGRTPDPNNRKTLSKKELPKSKAAPSRDERESSPDSEESDSSGFLNSASSAAASATAAAAKNPSPTKKSPAKKLPVARKTLPAAVKQPARPQIGMKKPRKSLPTHQSVVQTPKRRWKPGTKALREIRAFQKTTNLLVPR